MAKKLTPFVIIYDFDGTLAPGNMQEYDFVPALKMKPEAFWKEAKQIANDQQADEILAYMHLVVDKANAARIPVHKKRFFGLRLAHLYFPGVEDWFKRIEVFGKSKGVKVAHFIISSGLREMIDCTCIAKHFTRIYASSFMYDHNGVAHWPALALNNP